MLICKESRGHPLWWLVPIPSVTAPHTGHGVSVPGTGIDDTGASERTDWMIWVWIEIGVNTSLVQVNRRWWFRGIHCKILSDAIKKSRIGKGPEEDRESSDSISSKWSIGVSAGAAIQQKNEERKGGKCLLSDLRTVGGASSLSVPTQPCYGKATGARAALNTISFTNCRVSIKCLAGTTWLVTRRAGVKLGLRT